MLPHIALSAIGALAWIVLGVMAYRHIDEGLLPLEEMRLPLRILVIFTSPLGFVIYERHLFHPRLYPDGK